MSDQSMNESLGSLPIQLSFTDIVLPLLQRRRWLVMASSAGVLLALVVVLLTPATYSTKVLFAPQAGGGALAGLAGVAAQFGVDVGGGQDELQTPDFYVTLIRSDGFLRRLAESHTESQSSALAILGRVAALYDISKRDEAAGLDRVVGRLKDLVTARVDTRSQVVEVSISTRDSALTVDLGRLVLSLVDTFNTSTRRSQAAAERVFIEQRLMEAHDSLRLAEQATLSFLQRNREYRNSPELIFRSERLQAEMTRQQGIVDRLTDALQSARIEEVRNTPVISVVQAPLAPLRPDRRYLVLKAFLGLLVGLLVAGVCAVAIQPPNVSPGPSAGLERRREMQELWRTIRVEARHPLQTLHSWFRG